MSTSKGLDRGFVSELKDAQTLRHIVLDFRQMTEFVRHPLIMAGADGVRYYDLEGKSYLDGISGIFVATVGHNNRRVIEAIKAQLDRISFAPPLHATNVPAIELAKKIAEITPSDLDTIKLLSGGSEATEAALKMARQYHKQTGNPTKYKVISCYGAYHGGTMGALAATGTTRRKWMFEPTLSGFVHIWAPTCYRCPFHLAYPDCGIRCATIIDDTIELEGPQTVAALIIEPISNTGGIVTPPPEYLPLVREICDHHSVLLIFDEIITGFGRTGNMFAAQTFDTLPDILCMGKGMSGGYAPLAGIAFRDHIAAAFWGPPDEHVEFAHGHTYAGNPIASAAGLACIAEIEERNLCSRACLLGVHLRSRITEEIGGLGVVGEMRGKGLLIGIEFVRHTATKEPFPSEIQFGLQVGRTALKKGLILRCEPDWVAFAPPLIATEDEVDEMVAIFAESVREVVATAQQ